MATSLFTVADNEIINNGGCIHTNCNTQSTAKTAANQRNSIKRHVLQLHVDCGIDCPGCLAVKKSDVIEYVIAMTKDLHDCASVETLGMWLADYQARNVNMHPLALSNPLILRENISKGTTATVKQYRGLTAERKLQTYSVDSHLTHIPVDLQRFLMSLLYADKKPIGPYPEFLMITSILCKTINREFVSGLGLRITAAASTMCRSETVSMFNKLGACLSYSYYTKLRKGVLANEGEHNVERIEHIRDTQSGFIHDNMQKILSSNKVVSGNGAENVVVTQVLLLWISGIPQRLKQGNQPISGKSILLTWLLLLICSTFHRTKLTYVFV